MGGIRFDELRLPGKLDDAEQRHEDSEAVVEEAAKAQAEAVGVEVEAA